MKILSVIVPCYNEQEVLPFFYKELIKVSKNIKNYKLEILFVDDGSVDNTLEIIKKTAQKDSKVRYISFSRNFGKEAAIYAGFQHCQGNLIVLMDADLQDPPTLIPDMIKAIEIEGYDSVATRRISRVGEPKIRSFFANYFYKLINKMSHIAIVPGARDFRIMTRRFLDAVLELSEYNRFTKGIFPWVGFKTKWLAYENINRHAGQTKWSFFKLFIYAMDGITAFSTTPLQVASVVGIFFCFFSFLGIILVALRELIWHISAYGWASMLCIILFMGGIQLMSIGILGQYLGKTYLETKKRPQYIINEISIKNK